MSDWPFVLAGYGVILGGLAVYAALLQRRLAAARRALLDETLAAEDE
jgi:hypothetical protein